MAPLYFAYGSNTSLAQMAGRCPSSARSGIGKLEDYRLVFPRFSTKRQCGAASVEPCLGEHVWGVIYQLDPADLINLDRQEGYRLQRAAALNNYNRGQVSVLSNGAEPVQCFTYFAPVQAGVFCPSAHYHGLIHSGAVENGLPVDYIEKLLQITLLSN